jgi:hypothetical protein
MESRNTEEDPNDANDIFGTSFPIELDPIILANITPMEMEGISTVSRAFRFFANDSYVWRLRLANFGIECSSEMTLPEFTHALREQKTVLWNAYKFEFLLDPCPTDAAAFLKTLFENPGIIYKDYWTVIGMGVPYAIEFASARGMEEMVLFLITQGHLVPLTRARSLCSAINGGYIEIVKHLINAGANVTDCRFAVTYLDYADGRITLSNVPLYSDNYHNMCPLASAIKNNRVEIARLLLDRGASMDDLSFVHPIDKDFDREHQRTVTQLIEESRLTLSDNMKRMIDEYAIQPMDLSHSPRMTKQI